MKVLSREELLKKEVLKKEFVQVGDNKDCGVYVRQMNAKEKNNWEMSQMNKIELHNKRNKKVGTSYEYALDDYRAKLAVNCVCDENGKLLFKPGDFAIISKNMSAATLEKIVDVAQELNAISEEDVEEIVKN